ncbi:MAG: sigma-54-dependent Fis family transcriptional regulator [Spirochaetes bacterium]|nr:sigma-54-dependent Fis family transcriptional regulator [Spirochaetota bacterium]
MYKLLIADDEPGIRALLTELFSADFTIDTVDRGDVIISLIKKNRYDILLLDLELPGKNGLDVISEIKESKLDIAVVILTASKDINTAIKAMKLGAYDFMTKPFENEKLVFILKNISEKITLENEIKTLRTEIKSNYDLEGFSSQSKAMKLLLKTVKQVINTDSTILISGESGTGKSILAKAIHYNSNRSLEPFKSLDCSTIPQDLIGSELFGHEKGSFTGAVSRKIGKFEAAGKGTLFLDEISNLSINFQTKLLTVLQEKEFERIGGNKIIKSDARIIAASNRDLKKMVAEGKFREDLYYRLNVVPVTIPSLRERADDIPGFIDFFLEKYNQEYKRNVTLTVDSRMFLTGYLWPGNVRQLENLIRRIVLLSADKISTYSEIVNFIRAEEGSEDIPALNNGNDNLQKVITLDGNGKIRSFSEIEKQVISEAIKFSEYNISHAAESLGISRKTIHNKIIKYNIPVKKSI